MSGYPGLGTSDHVGYFLDILHQYIPSQLGLVTRASSLPTGTDGPCA